MAALATQHQDRILYAALAVKRQHAAAVHICAWTP